MRRLAGVVLDWIAAGGWAGLAGVITDRDREIVELLDRTGGLEASSLRLMLGLGHPVVYRRLARLQEYGMARPAVPFRKMPGLYLPTRRGLRELLGLDDTDPPQITAGSYNHQVQVGRVVAQLHASGVRWESARGTRRRQRAARQVGDHAAERRHALDLRSERRSHLPDALIWPSEKSLAADLPVALEVELARKTNRRLDEILDGYAYALGMRGVVYVCGPHCHGTVLRAVARGDRGWVVSVTTLHEFGPGIDLPARPGRPARPRQSGGPTWIDRYLTGRDDLEQRFTMKSPEASLPFI